MFDEEEEFNNGEFQADIDAFEKMYNNGEFEFMDSDQLEMIIDHCIISNSYAKAKWCVENAILYYPFNATFKLRKAQILSANGELKEALELLSSIEKIDGFNLELLLTKANCFSQLRDSARAIKYFEMALNYAEKIDKDEIYLDLSMEYQNANDYNRAIIVLKKAIKENPKNEVAVYELAFCYDQEGDFKLAIDSFAKYIDENPYSFTAWYNLANAYLKLDNFEKAIWAYDYCLLINEDFIPAQFNLGNAYLADSKYQKALECFEVCLDKEGEDGLILSYMGECYEEMGKLDLAMNCYKRSTIISPSLPEAWLGMGIVNDLNGRSTEALNLVNKAIELAPENGSYYHVLAGVYEKLEDLQSAIFAYQKGWELDSTNEDLALDYFKCVLYFNPEAVEDLYTSDIAFETVYELDIIRVYAFWLSGKFTDSILLLDNLILTDEVMAKRLFLHFPEAKEFTEFTDRITE